MFFLTEIDPRAAIKGSRDALGFQPIWSSIGRKVVGNLITANVSLRNFTTLLLGLHFAEEAISTKKTRGGTREPFPQVRATRCLQPLRVWGEKRGRWVRNPGNHAGEEVLRRARRSGSDLSFRRGTDPQQSEELRDLGALYRGC